MAKIEISSIKYPDGTVKYMICEVRERSWGKTVHPVMHPEYSHVGSVFTPITLTKEQIDGLV